MARTQKKMVQRTVVMARRKKVEVATRRRKAVMMRKKRRKRRRKMSLKISRRSLKLVSAHLKRYDVLPAAHHGLRLKWCPNVSARIHGADNTTYRLHEDYTMRATEARVRRVLRARQAAAARGRSQRGLRRRM